MDRARLVAALASLSLAACAALGTVAYAQPAATGSARPPKLPATETPTPLPPGEAFGLDLLGAQPPGNVVVSPDSVATALAMAGTGARGKTAEQIAGVLHLSGPRAFDSVGNQQANLMQEQATAAEGHANPPTLAIANGLFVQAGYPLVPAFTAGLGEHFGVAPEAVDFADLPAAIAAINRWTSDHTGGVIPELFSTLPEATRLVLTNAVYLKARWRHQFEPTATRPAPFYGSGGTTSAEFMHQTSSFLYGTGPGYKAVELPYRASDLSMLVVLPVEGGVGSLERQLDGSGLQRVVGSLSKATVRLSLPRFHLNTDADLAAALARLGMPLAFSEAGDFSGITSAERLKIAAVRHIADIDVDEEGTEAAAVTGVVLEPEAEPTYRHLVTFNANHPFLFFVRDDETGALLFAGRLTDPAAAAAG